MRGGVDAGRDSAVGERAGTAGTKGEEEEGFRGGDGLVGRARYGRVGFMRRGRPGGVGVGWAGLVAVGSPL